jgi:hypothetical protein
MRLPSQASPISIDIAYEAKTLSRLLCAISLSSNLQDALMRFYAFLPNRESLRRTSLVLARVNEILPYEVATKLRLTRSFSSSASSNQSGKSAQSLAATFVGPALFILGGIVFVFTIVGAFTTCGYIAKEFHLFESGSAINQFLRNLFFMVCLCADHSEQ